MSNDKMREQFEAWFEEQQIENTQFPKLLGLYEVCKPAIYDAWKAALAQQASEPAQVSQFGSKELQDRIAAASIKKENDVHGSLKHWKSNHAYVVQKLAIATQRPDLPVDRIPAIKELERLQERVAELEGIAIRTDEVITEATENVIQIIAERDKLQKDAARWDYVMQTTTAIHDAGQVRSCTPDQFKAAVDSAMEKEK